MSSMRETNRRLEELRQRWQELAVKGESVSVEELCQDCPELLEPLRQQIVEVETGLKTEHLAASPDQVETRIPAPGAWDEGIPHPTAFGETLEQVAITTRFQELEFYRRGGLGELFTCQDESLQRQVIVKFIQTRHAEDALTCSRFVAEAEITARLDHPGVVPVYGLGHTLEGRPFYAMRLIRGRTLDEALEEYHRQGPTDPGERAVAFRSLLASFISVCHTLSYAHNRGILHRDVKPQNIMLGRYGETLVVDWGLAIPFMRGDRAKASGEETLTPESSGSQLSSGNAVGTPAYMSPEQSHPDIALTPAADIYSLGATLYKILTGMVPFSGRSSSEVLDKVRRSDFPAPCRVQSNVPRALEAICVKAMSYNPEQRYALAADMGTDLERWLADEPVKAYQETRWEQTQRFIRRNWAWVQSVALSLVVLLGVVLPMGMWYRNDLLERKRVAHELRESRLREASSFVSATLAAEIDLRWKSLEREAADPELHRILNDTAWTAEWTRRKAGAMDAKKPGANDPLLKWITARALYNRDFTQADSWFVTDADGYQLARYPLSDTIGDLFRYRSYFHGGDRDLKPEEAANVPISAEFHRTSVFKSAATKKWMIAFSAPIPGLNRSVRGRLTMSVELGKFTSINRGLGTGQAALLVDTRMYDGEREAVVLHHPQWEKTPLDDVPIAALPTLSPDLVPKLKQLRDRRDAGIADERSVLIEEYNDPLGGEYAGRWLAAFQPVFVHRKVGGRERDMDTGLIIIVETRAGQ